MNDQLDGKINGDGEFIPTRAMRLKNESDEKKYLTGAHPLGYTVAIPAVQAEGYEYYSTREPWFTVQTSGDKRKSLPSYGN